MRGRSVAEAAAAPHLQGVLFDVVDRLWPVPFQEPREGPIGQELSSGLTARAVIRLVVGVDDSLHGRAAVGARLAELAVNGHVRTKGGDLCRKAIPRLTAQSV